jgi:PhnB protein
MTPTLQTDRPSNIPEGYQTVMPYLIVNDGGGFIEFMKKVFDAREKMRYLNDQKRIMHAEITIAECTIMFAESTEKYKSSTGGFFIYVVNADETWKKALEAGAGSIEAPSDKEYGRSCGVSDPYGNTWWITSAK